MVTPLTAFMLAAAAIVPHLPSAEEAYSCIATDPGTQRVYPTDLQIDSNRIQRTYNPDRKPEHGYRAHLAGASIRRPIYS